VEVRPAALKNEEAQEARKQHADNGAGTALFRYGVTVLHAPTTTSSRRRCQLASRRRPSRRVLSQVSGGRCGGIWVAHA
jgi:hypothetical protein